MRRTIIPYEPRLKELARELRNNSTKAEVMLWKSLKGKQCFGYDFHRQKPLFKYIVDFFCYELMLAIEIDGLTHHDPDVHLKDLEKEKFLVNSGIHVIRFTDEEVYFHKRDVLAEIERYVIEHEKIVPCLSRCFREEGI